MSRRSGIRFADKDMRQHENLRCRAKPLPFCQRERRALQRLQAKHAPGLDLEQTPDLIRAGAGLGGDILRQRKILSARARSRFLCALAVRPGGAGRRGKPMRSVARVGDGRLGLFALLRVSVLCGSCNTGKGLPQGFELVAERGNLAG
jgi:hypothetical protein